MPREIGKRRANTDAGFEQGSQEGRTRVTKEQASNIGDGWSSDRKAPVTRGGGNIKRFTVDETGKEVLIKFIEAKPFVSFWQHWINKKPYTCVIDNCPLCNIGDNPKSVDCINVIKFGEGGPETFVWMMTPDPANAVKARATSPRTSPINKDGLYWAAYKTLGKNGFPSYSIDPVKGDELKDDWGTEPLTDAQIEELAKDGYDSELAQQTPRHELQQLADSLED